MHFNYDKEARSFEDVCAIYAGEKMGKYKMEKGSMGRKEGDTSITVSYVKNYSGLQRFGRLLQGLAYTLCTVFVGLADLRLRHKFEAAFVGKVTKVVRCDSDAYTKAEKILKSFQSGLQPASHQKIEENEEEPQIEVEVVRYTESPGETDSEKHCKSIFEAEKMLRGGKTDEAIAKLEDIESWTLPPTLKSLGLGVVGEAKRQKLALELLRFIIVGNRVPPLDTKRSDYIARSYELRRLLEKALEADPQNAKASASLGASLLQGRCITYNKDPSEACGYLSDAITPNRDDPEVQVHLALALQAYQDCWALAPRPLAEAAELMRMALDSFLTRSRTSDTTEEATLPADIKIAMLNYFLGKNSPGISPENFETLASAVLEDINKIAETNCDQAIHLLSALGYRMVPFPAKKIEFSNRGRSLFTQEEFKGRSRA